MTGGGFSRVPWALRFKGYQTTYTTAIHDAIASQLPMRSSLAVVTLGGH